MSAPKDDIATVFGQLVLRHGYRRAAVEDVARALHISKKTIYEHFGSKEGLYRASVMLWAAQQRQRVESLLTEVTALGRIEQVTAIALADARRSAETEAYPDPDGPPEIVAQVNAHVFGPMVRDLLEEGHRTGEFCVEDPELTTAFALAIGTEAVRLILEDPERRPEQATLDALRRLVAGSVTPRS